MCVHRATEDPADIEGMKYTLDVAHEQIPGHVLADQTVAGSMVSLWSLSGLL